MWAELRVMSTLKRKYTLKIINNQTLKCSPQFNIRTFRSRHLNDVSISNFAENSRNVITMKVFFSIIYVCVILRQSAREVYKKKRVGLFSGTKG